VTILISQLEKVNLAFMAILNLHFMSTNEKIGANYIS